MPCNANYPYISRNKVRFALYVNSGSRRRPLVYVKAFPCRDAQFNRVYHLPMVGTLQFYDLPKNGGHWLFLKHGSRAARCASTAQPRLHTEPHVKCHLCSIIVDGTLGFHGSLQSKRETLNSVSQTSSIIIIISIISHHSAYCVYILLFRGGICIAAKPVPSHSHSHIPYHTTLRLYFLFFLTRCIGLWTCSFSDSSPLPSIK
jgi:hypothetical protein